MARIMVVDDNRLERWLLRAHLATAGHEVIEAAHGLEALDLLAQHGSDVIITDIVMPEMDGFETIMTLRRRHPDTRIIAISGAGRAPGDYLEVAAKLGAHLTLRKPIARSKILAAVRESVTESVAQTLN